MVRYLKAKEILVLHALVIDKTGGTHGVRDVHLLASIAERPQTTFDGKELHSDLFRKAAVLCEALINYHVFVDGNKRTGFVTIARFMAVNGYELTASNKEVEETMIAIAEKKFDIEMLTEWVRSNSREL